MRGEGSTNELAFSDWEHHDLGDEPAAGDPGPLRRTPVANTNAPGIDGSERSSVR